MWKGCEQRSTSSAAKMEGHRIIAAVLFCSLCLALVDCQDVEPPFIRTNPQASTVTVNSRLAISCLATGSAPISYQWQVNGTGLGSSGTDGLYVYQNIAKTDAGVYRCVAENVVGKVLSRGADVHVTYFEDYTGETKATTVTAGDTKILTCPPYDSYPPPTITWQFDGADLLEDQRRMTTADHRLVLLLTDSSDQGTYACKANNHGYGSVQTGPGINLTVQGSINLPSYVAPTIEVAPSDTVVRPGDTFVEMECIVSAHPLSSLLIQWYKDGSSLTDTGPILKLYNPALTDAGVYRCVAQLQGSGFPSVQASANLTMYIAPLFTVPPAPDREVEEAAGSSFSLPCQASGVPAPVISWYQDSVNVNSLADSRFTVEADGSLRVTDVAKSDSGMFQCQALNEVGEDLIDVWLQVKEIAPVITLAPNDTTILEGETAVLQCTAEGAPHPTIHWLKDGASVSGGSRLPLAESGDLVLSEAVQSDSGLYTCVATNTLDTTNASATLTVYQLTYISQKPTSVQTILGQTSTLTCVVQHDDRIAPQVAWTKDGSEVIPDSRLVVQASGSLVIYSTNANDMGLYTCRVTSVAGNDQGSANLTVLQTPYKPQSVQAAQSVDVARTIMVSWVAVFDGNSPLIRYILEQKEDDSSFEVIESTIDPAVTSFAVTGVKPSRRYQYRLQAQNAIGTSEPSDPSNVVHLPQEPPDEPPQSLRASAASISSIIVEFREPPYESWNGALQGYMVQWRLQGYNIDYDSFNISDYQQTSYTISGLVTWTLYEIRVAAYNGAGVGAFTNTIHVRTLEGVPTAPPQNVVVSVLSSTAFHYAFQAPPIELINGINQGYKLEAWEPGEENDPMIMIVSADPSQTRLSGNMTGLKKYTLYQAAVRCFTTPGDGPTSTPTPLTTLEDVPGPVSNLHLPEISDTSLNVAWDPPTEPNGALTGYVIKWDEENTTSTNQQQPLPASTTSYLIMGLTPQTTYVIQVWAETSIGSGPKTSTIISSGVTPEPPQPPTDLTIPESSIEARSLSLHFIPGFDGDAGITLWTVQALVDQSSAPWGVIHQHSDPMARQLAVTGLTPYTLYQLRMIATNVAGSSNASRPSRQVRTKQDVPDLSPSDMRVRPYSSTQLRITWVPLDNKEWNGVPGGYHIYWRQAGSQAAEMTLDLASPYSNEHIIDGLDEWTMYDVRMEAYNEEYSGPSSGVVRGWTHEDVPSAGPADVQASAIHYTQIMVLWGDVPDQDKNGQILGFKIIYRESGGSLLYQDVPGNASRSGNLVDLKGYTVYTITVLAYTTVGDGAIGNEVPVRTLEWVPSAPVGITFPMVQLTSVTITWDAPLEPNGPNLKYKVGYRLESAPASSVVEADVGTSRQHGVTGLQPQETYRFEVTARTSMGDGDVATALVVTSTNRTTPGPPSKPSVDHIQSREVRLSWTPPASDGNSPLRYYVIEYKVVSGQWVTHGDYIDGSLVSYTVDGLMPYTTYRFRLKVYNDIGASPNSQTSDQTTTEQEIPSDAPTMTGLTPVTVTSLLIAWDPPPQPSWNGPLTGYSIQFRQLPGNGFMEETVGVDVTEHELLNLVRYTNYEVQIAALNGKGLGPYGTPEFVYIGEAVPSEPPSNVRVVAQGASVFQIAWTPPSVESQNGGLQGYKVVYWEDTSRRTRSSEPRTKTFPASSTDVLLEDLDCFTDYAVTVKGFNSAGDGPESDPSYGKTEEDVPSQVSYLTFSHVRMTSLNVSWGVPSTPCGVITQYTLFYESLMTVNGERTSITVRLPGDQLYYTPSLLEERVEYRFEVRAETAQHSGPVRAANITTGPQIGGPDAPSNLETNSGSDSVTISWVEPGYHGSQPLTGYIIQSKETGQSGWDDVSDDIAADQSEYVVPYTDMEPSQSYVFRIMAENVISVSEPAITESVTAPAVTTESSLTTSIEASTEAFVAAPQKAFYEEWWFLVIVALVGVIVIILVGATLCMLGRSKLYVDRKVHKRMTPDERVSVTEDGGFTSFEMDPAARRSARNGRAQGRGGVYARTNSYTSGSEEPQTMVTFLGPSTETPNKLKETRPPPRPSPGSIQYSEEEESKHYEDVRRRGEEPGENSSLTEKADLHSLSESLASESESEIDQGAHGGGPSTFVNHYASLPGSQSWRRQQHSQQHGQHQPHHNHHNQQAAPSLPSSNAYSYTDSEPDPVPPISDGRTIYLQGNLAHMQPGSRAPVHGFSSFV